MTPTFAYVEDYIEFIGGYRDSSGKQLGIFDTVPTPLSLARYDVKVIESLADQTGSNNQAYTDKQAKLAASLVDKYRKQLSKLPVPIIVPETLDKFRLGIRVMDRTRGIYIADDKLYVRFPFDTKLIELMRVLGKQGEGSAAFDYDNKVWVLGLTEHHVNWVMAIAESYEFTVAEEVKELYRKILEIEQTPYKIELVEQDGKFTITNAADSLIEYIEQNLGGFGLENYVALVDNASVLGYEVDPWLVDKISSAYGVNAPLLLTRNHNFKRDEISMDDVVAYAKAVNRLPVYVYSHGLPKKDTDDIKYLNRKVDPELQTKLLITSTNMMIGSRKQAWITNAEKIFLLE
jgi:hypothetical protein